MKALGWVDYTKNELLAIILYVKWSKAGSVKNAVNLSKVIFSSLNFFIHIFNTCEVLKGYTEDSRRSWLVKVCLLQYVKWSKIG